jgi:hypothetical protein
MLVRQAGVMVPVAMNSLSSINMRRLYVVGPQRFLAFTLMEKIYMYTTTGKGESASLT